MRDWGPIETCLGKHKSNSTLEFHECVCHFEYANIKGGSRVKALKMKHCLASAEMMKMDNFYSYIIGGAVAIVLIVAFIAAICSFKWYIETKKNPCSCCSLFCCCNKRKKKKKRSEANEIVNVFEQSDTGHTWSPINLPPNREGETAPTTPTDESRDPSICMNFCLSDPVQDCCEFFDCDIMWRKKSIYTIPIFGKKKQHHHLQRRPSRPAPPPPKAVVLPQIKNPDPVVLYEDEECEPVPEAPPSPEPVRTMPSKAMYVDPLAFLHSTFVKNSQTEKKDPAENDSKQEPLYSKFKNMVGLISKVKKSVSMASLNKLGLSSDPNGVSTNPSGSASNKKMKTASLASLNNLGEDELDASYGSKRSLSLASLHMLQDQGAVNNGMLDPRSRASVLSTMSTATDDIPPSARKDEYIDLEEMSKRIEAKMQAARSLGVSPVPSPQPPPVAAHPQQMTQSPTVAYTPNFMPASAYIPPPKPNQQPVSSDMHHGHSSFVNNERVNEIKFFSPIPATQGRPAIPARTSAGAPIFSGSPSASMGRPKPAVPPRPPTGEAAKSPSSPRTATLPRSPRLVKPSGPPPPPPTANKTPIESSI